MKLRTKTLLVICIIFSMLCLILTVTLDFIIMRSYSDLEKNSVSDQVVRVFHQFDQETSNLEALSWDWSIWDDTYSFIEDTNETFIQNNLLYDIFEDIDINFMLFYNRSGTLVYSKAFDFQQENETILPLSLYSDMSKNKRFLITNLTEESSHSGIILYDTNETPLFLSRTPILHSNRDGPIIGSMIVGRYLDEKKIESIETITQLELTLHPLSDNLTLDLKYVASDLDGKLIYVRPINSTNIAGYISLNDIYGNPVFILQVSSTRDVYNQGINVIQKLIVSLVLAIVFMVSITIILLDKYVTSRLTHLVKSVDNIRNYQDLSKLLQVTGNDEISDLEHNINTMLASLQKSGAMKDSAEFSLQMKIDELERFKAITIDREIKMIELKKQLNEFKTKSGGTT
jgi:sensor domain CHASE-containing protein